jgi:hypothetical protein
MSLRIGLGGSQHKGVGREQQTRVGQGKAESPNPEHMRAAFTV